MKDIFSDPAGAWSDAMADADAANQKRVDEQQALKQYNEAWRLAIEETNVETLLSLGKILQERGCMFWLDVYRLQIEEDPAIDEGKTSFETILRLAAVRILTLSCEPGSRKKLAALMKQCESKSGLLESIKECKHFEDIQRSLSAWENSITYPATPHIKRTDLEEALKSMEGMSKSNISKAINKTDKEGRPIPEIIVRDERRGKARYWHKDLEKQLTILGHVSEFLKKK